MKKIILSISYSFFAFFLLAQAPQGIKYQAVVRGPDGTPIASQTTSMLLSVRYESVDGEEVYSEVHQSSTNAFGLVNLTVGGGLPVHGSFSDVKWEKGHFFLKISFDAVGLGQFVELGTSEILSVPYAFFSEETGSVRLTSPKGVFYNLKVDDAGNIITEAAGNDCEDVHWEYDGEEDPSHWGDLCLGYMDCGGDVQTPIDVVTADVVADNALSALSTNYLDTETDLINNGHTIQLNYESGSVLTLNGKDYDLLQFHFHTGSEHVVDGSQFPMEVHLVHSNPDGTLAVVGIFFEVGAENALLAPLMSFIPTSEGEYTSDMTLNAADLLPVDRSYYTYSGSLTTPPCSEIVTWVVMQNTITASQAQLDALSGILHNNFRPLQALNGRTIKSFNE